MPTELHVPEPPINPPEPKHMGYCEGCKGDVFAGEDVVDLGTNYVHYHDDCLVRWFRGLGHPVGVLYEDGEVL